MPVRHGRDLLDWDEAGPLPRAGFFIGIGAACGLRAGAGGTVAEAEDGEFAAGRGGRDGALGANAPCDEGIGDGAGAVAGKPRGCGTAGGRVRRHGGGAGRAAGRGQAVDGATGAAQPARRRGNGRRELARPLFEGGTTLAGIAAAVGVTTVTVRRWAQAEGWRRMTGAGMTGAGMAGRRMTGARPSGMRSTGTRAGETPGGGPGPVEHGADRGALVGRLMRAFARQVSEVEARLGGEGGADERDARTLGVLAKTLETLIDLDRTAQGERTDGEEAKNLDAVREELARRLDRLRQTG